jgi:5-methylcytosine-specific restriction protein A
MKEEWLDFKKDQGHIKREKRKAQLLKKTQWWKNRLARGICHYCGKKYLPAELTMDHIVPLARGGKSTKGNVVPCCKSCNNRKKYLTPLDMKLKELTAKK